MSIEQTSAILIAQYHYDPATGEIKNRADCAFLMDLPGLVAVEGTALDNHYVDIDTQSLTPIPAQPTTFHVWSWASKTWDDPRTLADFKALKRTEIKNARTRVTNAGVELPGLGVFDCDVTARQNVMGAQAGAKLLIDAGLPFSINWTRLDNSIVTLNYEQLCALGIALLQHVQTLRDFGDLLLMQIEAATTRAEVDAIVWPE